jgi:hypothetical protein
MTVRADVNRPGGPEFEHEVRMDELTLHHTEDVAGALRMDTAETIDIGLWLWPRRLDANRSGTPW